MYYGDGGDGGGPQKQYAHASSTMSGPPRQQLYVINGMAAADAPRLPARNKRGPPPHASVHTVALLALSVLLCLFGCTITVALSYRWHADTDRQIERLVTTVQQVKYDLDAFADAVRDELAARRAHGGRTTAAAAADEKPDGDDYEELERGWEADRFMNKDLFDNSWPDKADDTYRRDIESRESDGDRRRRRRRRRRGAEVGPAVVAANKSNGSFDGKSDAGPPAPEQRTEDNTVKTHGQRKPRKMAPKKKPAAELRDDGSYEDFKEASSDTAAAAHFTSDSMKYNSKINTNYHGNGRLNHPNGDFRDWTPLVWDTNLDNDDHFAMNNGRVEITKPGLYFVYAQVYYSDQHDINGYYVMKNDEKVLGCTTARNSNSCYTGGLVYLKTKDILSVKGVDSQRFIILDPVRSFFGLFKVSKDTKR